MSFSFSLRELFACVACVAFGIVSVKLAFNRRIAPGSVPNVYLLVVGIAFFVMIPILYWRMRQSAGFFKSIVLSFLVSVLLVAITLVFCVLNGNV